MLTSAQRRYLTRCRELRDRPARLVRSLVRQLPRLVLAVLLVLFVSRTSAKAATFLSGIFVGVFLRDLALFVQARRLTTLFMQIIDWNKVDQLLDEPGRTT